MQRALRLATRGQGAVEPNPMVGCVIVKSGQVIGEGFHRRFGGPHAEAFAIKNCVNVAARRDGLCHARTVLLSRQDAALHGRPDRGRRQTRRRRRRKTPNPRVAGGGLKLLEQAGIDVKVGVCADEADTLNAPFTKLIKQHRPWVILKWAQSLDGKIATRTGDAKWITDEQSREARPPRAWPG